MLPFIWDNKFTLTQYNIIRRNKMAHFIGTNGDDILPGAGQNNTGDDTMGGGEGQDSIQGGSGNDSLLGDDGNDLIVGGDNNDTLRGGDNRDTLRGGNGDDLLQGESGNDFLFDNNGSNNLDGGEGNDTLTGGSLDVGGVDTLLGGIGDDLLRRDATVGRVIYNGFGGDVENDTLTGGNGSVDQFVLGDRNGIFYDAAGSFALIENFSEADGDKIRLFGNSTNYVVEFDNRFGAAATDTVLRNSATNDVVAVFADVSLDPITLLSADTIFV
jgi:Ca2+-binding RTX toxin-like protein